MTAFIFKRLLTALPLLFLVLTTSFLLVRLAPGSPFLKERDLPPETLRSLEDRYGLNQPWSHQFGRYLKGLARGDLGPSYRYRDKSVNQIIREGLPISAELGLLAYGIALVSGLTFGLLSAAAPGAWWSQTSMLLATLGISVPNFVLGPLLALLFGVTLYWLPPAGWGGWRHAILPALTLSGAYAAYIARLTRAGILTAMATDFARTARAVGVGQVRLLLRHVLRNAILPVITFSGPALAFLITGTVVVEKVYAIPGLGNFFVKAAFNRDYTLLMGIVIFVSTSLIVMNLVVDVFYAIVDPRIRYDRT